MGETKVKKSKKPRFLEFNINDHVWVRITPEGLLRHRQDYEDLKAAYGSAVNWEYKPPIIDAQGWSQWQMHHLMRQFGGQMNLGNLPPFETTIRIEVTPAP